MVLEDSRCFFVFFFGGTGSFDGDGLEITRRQLVAKGWIRWEMQGMDGLLEGGGRERTTRRGDD